MKNPNAAAAPPANDHLPQPTCAAAPVNVAIGGLLFVGTMPAPLLPSGAVALRPPLT